MQACMYMCVCIDVSRYCMSAYTNVYVFMYTYGCIKVQISLYSGRHFSTSLRTISSGATWEFGELRVYDRFLTFFIFIITIIQV